MDADRLREKRDEDLETDARSAVAAERLAVLVDARLKELLLTPSDLVRLTGLSWGGLAPIRRGEPRSYSRRVKTLVAEALRWTPDSIDRILTGDNPRELPTVEEAREAAMGALRASGREDQYLAAQKAVAEALMGSPAFSVVRIAAKAERITPEQRSEIEAKLNDMLGEE